ncbi:hypothetical protein DFI02_1011289 [Rhizobium sp. PP-F2F-G20b]|nr:hypothetical protein DFI02_1011289 [Rhizobium sp. PP-F2F-G20b]
MTKKSLGSREANNSCNPLVLVTRDPGAVSALLNKYQSKRRRSQWGLHIKLLPPAPLSPVISEAQELEYLDRLLQDLAAAADPASLADTIDDIDLLQTYTEHHSIRDRCSAARSGQLLGYSPSEPAEGGL